MTPAASTTTAQQTAAATTQTTASTQTASAGPAASPAAGAADIGTGIQQRQQIGGSSAGASALPQKFTLNNGINGVGIHSNVGGVHVCYDPSTHVCNSGNLCPLNAPGRQQYSALLTHLLPCWPCY